MRKGNGRFSRVMAACMAALMTFGSAVIPFGSGPERVYAADDFEFGKIYDPVRISSSTFPDPNFRAVVSADFDRDKNGILDSDEIVYARNLWCVDKGIKSLKGIEYLKELRGIYCMQNQISSWDLSKNTLLTGIWCSDNLFTSLDFTVNENLEWVYAYNCRLTSINVKDNKEISYLELNSNPLKTIDVSHNEKLEHLMVGDCDMDTLDVTHNPNLQHLDAFRNHFKSLDLSNNPKMKRLDVWDNPDLGDVDTSNMPGLQYYNCAANGCTSVDVSKNPELTKLICSYNRENLKSIDVSNNPKLTILQCQDNTLESLDVSNNPQLRFLYAAYNLFTTINIGDNPFLIQTLNEGIKKAEYYSSTSWHIDYGGDDSTGGDNKFYLWLDNDVKILKNATRPGLSDEFPPDDPNLDTSNLITRETMVQTLYQMAGKPSVSGLKSRFTDVLPGQWYTDALLWGEANAICVGYPYMSADRFGVGQWLTRQDLMLMLMRYTEYKENWERSIDFGRSDDFMDYFDVDYDHWEAVCWAATWHIMEGKGAPGAPKEERKIDPYGKATKTEVIEMIERMYELNKIDAKATLATPGLTITKQPVNRNVTAGTKATFSVEVIGKGTLSYQWQYRKNAAFAWTNSGQPGANTKTLTVSTNADMSSIQFRCMVTGPNGQKAYSNIVTLSVIPKITSQPTGATAPTDATAVFHVAASGTGPLSYQWQSRKDANSAWTNSGQPGAKTRTLSVTTKNGLNGWQFRCVVTDGHGQKAYTSAATLTITPYISSQPANKSVTAGTTATFTVAATGTGTLTYQWQSRKDASSAWTNSGQSGATTKTLSVATTAGLHGWQFRCIITDGSGRKNYTNAATLSIVPKITTQPKSVSVRAKTTAKFTVAATGTGPLTYQWQSRKDSSSAWTNSGQTGSKTKTLSVATTKGLNGWQFRCVVTDANGQKTDSGAATLTVK